jgi:hydroxymethylbilane synthase
MRLKISARKSDLARLQAYFVADALKEKHPHLEFEFLFKESLGDKNLIDPLWKIPQKGVFTEDFHGELLRDETDMVVHSWKDLPTEHKSDTVIAATLPRADQRDLLLIKKSDFTKLRQTRSLRVFSSSPRREYNLTDFFKKHLPFGLEKVQFESVRGNIPTRVRKLLESNEVSGLIVAKAALDRLLSAPYSEFSEVQKLLRGYLEQLEWAALPLSVNPNAAAQGALAVEVASHRKDILSIVESINQTAAFTCAQKERDVLSSFGGGCHQKIGIAVLSRPYGTIEILKGLTDGGQVLDSRVLHRDLAAPKFSESQMLNVEIKTERQPLPAPKIPSTTNALYVARREAWPQGLQFDGLVWTSGAKTWQALAEQGVWVHGCSEGFGEQEESFAEILAGEKLSWSKLSHQDGFASDNDPRLLANYKVQFLETPDISGKEFFYWHSGSQFLFMLQKFPELRGRTHACGPGNTFKIISQHLTSRPWIFLDQDDWRKQCTK